jgi:acyl carrier protein
MSSVENEIRQFITDNFLFGATDISFTGDDSLLDKGIVDSTGVLELVVFLEQKYGIRINDKELIPDNLDSLNKLIAFIGRKTAVPVSG